MVIPTHITEAAENGENAIVQAWLDEAGPGRVNEVVDDTNLRLLHFSTCSESCDLTKALLTRGADVNLCEIGGWAALQYACNPPCSPAIVQLLLQSGALVNVRTTNVRGFSTHESSTPLGHVLMMPIYIYDDSNDSGDDESHISRGSEIETIEALLRAGASLDRCRGEDSAEGLMRKFLAYPNSVAQGFATDEKYIECQNLVAGVRAHGSYKRYLLVPHRQFLRLRSLLVRGRAKTADDRIKRIKRLLNGAVWNVLSYWREAE